MAGARLYFRGRNGRRGGAPVRKSPRARLSIRKGRRTRAVLDRPSAFSKHLITYARDTLLCTTHQTATDPQTTTQIYRFAKVRPEYVASRIFPSEEIIIITRVTG